MDAPREPKDGFELPVPRSETMISAFAKGKREMENTRDGEHKRRLEPAAPTHPPTSVISAGPPDRSWPVAALARHAVAVIAELVRWENSDNETVVDVLDGQIELAWKCVELG